MNRDYTEAAMRHATYEVIDDPEPHYGHIEELPGLWATGTTEAECRERLAEVVAGWVIVRLRLGMAIPPVDGVRIAPPRQVAASD